MENNKKGLSRRSFLKATAASAAVLATGVPAVSAAPARKPSARQNEVVIQFGLYGFWQIPAEGGPEGADQTAMQAFLDANPNVKLEQIDVNIWDAGVLRTNIAGGTAPAYYMSGVISGWNTAGTLSAFKQGLFADITPLYQQYDIDSKLGTFARSVNRGKIETSEGQFYGLPFEIAIGNGIVYRKDLLLAAGFEEPTMDWTWEDVREMAKALTGDFTKGIAMQPWALGWVIGANGIGGEGAVFSHIPAPDTSWNWRRDYEANLDEIVKAAELFRTMMFEDESVLTDVTSNDQVAEDSFYNRTAAMASIPGQFITRTGIPHAMAIAEEEGMPFDEIIGFMSHPRGANGYFPQDPSNQPISFSPDLSPEQLDVLVRMYDFLELGDGFDLTMRQAYEETGDIKYAYGSWPFVRAKEGIDGVEGSPRDAWGNFVDFVEFMGSFIGRPEQGAFIPAEENQGPTEDAWYDARSRLTFESGNLDAAGLVKEAQNVWNAQAADFESSVPDEAFVQGAAEYYAALATYWEEKFPGFYEATFKPWYESVIAGALGM